MRLGGVKNISSQTGGGGGGGGRNKIDPKYNRSHSFNVLTCLRSEISRVFQLNKCSLSSTKTFVNQKNSRVIYLSDGMC